MSTETDAHKSDLSILKETMKQHEKTVFDEILKSLEDEDIEQKNDNLKRTNSKRTVHTKRTSLFSFPSFPSPSLHSSVAASLFFQPAPVVTKTPVDLNRNTNVRLFKRSQSLPIFSGTVNRETITYSIRLLGQISKNRFAKSVGFVDIGDELNKIAETVSCTPDTVYEESIMTRKLAALAARCSLIDQKMAADIWLVTADYYEFLLNWHVDAANALDRASGFVENTRRQVELLEQSRDLYVKGLRYDHALRVERRLEGFDMSVDWKVNSRNRQREYLRLCNE